MEDYTLTNSRGTITTRADDIEEAKKSDPKCEIFENHDMKVRVHADTAVVLGITHAKGISVESLSMPNSNSRTRSSKMVASGACSPVMSPKFHKKANSDRKIKKKKKIAAAP
jgi:hypothetical protein